MSSSARQLKPQGRARGPSESTHGNNTDPEKRVGPWENSKTPQKSANSATRRPVSSRKPLSTREKIETGGRLNISGKREDPIPPEMFAEKLGGEARRLEPLSPPIVSLMGSSSVFEGSLSDSTRPSFGSPQWHPNKNTSRRHKLKAVLRHRSSPAANAAARKRLGLDLRTRSASTATKPPSKQGFRAQDSLVVANPEEKNQETNENGEDTILSNDSDLTESDDESDEDWAKGLSKKQLVDRVERLHKYSQNLLEQGTQQEKLAKKVFKFEEENFLLQSQHEELSRRIREKEEYSNMVEKQWKTMRERVGHTALLPQLKEENRRLRNANGFLGAQHEKISSRNKLLAQNNESFFEEIKGLNEQIEQLESRNAQLDKQNKLLQRKLTETIAKLNDTTIKLREAEQLVEETQKSAGGLIKTLQEAADVAAKTIQDLSLKNKSLKDENQSVLALMGARTIETSKWRSEKRNLLGERMRQVKEIDTMRIKLSETETELNSLKSLHSKCLGEEVFEVLEAKVRASEVQNERHAKEKKILEVEVAETHSALVALKTKFEGAQRALQEANKGRNQSESLLNKVERESKILVASTEQMKNRMEKAEGMNADLKHQAEKAQQHVVETDIELKSLVEEKETMEVKLLKATNDCIQQQQQIDSLKSEIATLETFGEEKSKEVQILSRLSEGIKERLKEANDKRLEMEIELKQVETKLFVTEDSLEQMQIERRDLEGDINETTSLKQDKKELQDALEKAQQDLSEQADKYRADTLKSEQLMAIERKRLMALHEKAELELIALRMRKGQNEERVGWLEKELNEERTKKQELQVSLEDATTKFLEIERTLTTEREGRNAEKNRLTEEKERIIKQNSQAHVQLQESTRIRANTGARLEDASQKIHNQAAEIKLLKIENEKLQKQLLEV